METVNIQGKFTEYKGLPLVCKDGEYFYGDMSEKYYLYILTMPNGKYMLQICDTKGHTPLPDKQKVMNTLTEAFDMGTAWLERANRS